LTSLQLDQLHEDDLYTVTWGILSPSDLTIERLFRAIANQDHGRTPSVKGRVYMLVPAAGLLMHMYDDRGMGIIPTSSAALGQLHQRFKPWINWARMESTVGSKGWEDGDASQSFE
jgi:hypothetical protein